MNFFEWIDCDICQKLMPHKRWEGKAINFLECSGCGNNIVERKERVA